MIASPKCNRKCHWDWWPARAYNKKRQMSRRKYKDCFDINMKTYTFITSTFRMVLRTSICWKNLKIMQLFFGSGDGGDGIFLLKKKVELLLWCPCEACCCSAPRPEPRAAHTRTRKRRTPCGRPRAWQLAARQRSPMSRARCCTYTSFTRTYR